MLTSNLEISQAGTGRWNRKYVSQEIKTEQEDRSQACYLKKGIRRVPVKQCQMPNRISFNFKLESAQIMEKYECDCETNFSAAKNGDITRKRKTQKNHRSGTGKEKQVKSDKARFMMKRKKLRKT